MSPWEIAAFCILWQLFHLSSCSIAHMKYSKLKAINWGLPLAGHKHNATPIATSRVTNHIKCMAQCGKTERCVAINIGPLQDEERKCEMLDTTRYSVSNFMNFTVQPGWTYIGPKTNCNANPCPKELLCIPQEDEADYMCLDLNGESCRAPLGMESGDILDNAILASSDHGSNLLYSFYARLNIVRGHCAWGPQQKNNQWIQVDLGFITAVTGVATQGRCDVRYPQWVTSYMVSYSTDAQYWTFCEEFGNEKIFTGNSDQTTVATHFFETPLTARYARLWPQLFKSHPSLRMEIYGCRIEN